MPSALLIQFIREANIGMIRMSWIKQQAKNGGVFRRRQDMPSEAFLPLSELREDIDMLVVSHF